jgi:hypothetical protein
VSFDVDYKSEPLEHFAPLLHKFFSLR